MGGKSGFPSSSCIERGVVVGGWGRETIRTLCRTFPLWRIGSPKVLAPCYPGHIPQANSNAEGRLHKSTPCPKPSQFSWDTSFLGRKKIVQNNFVGLFKASYQQYILYVCLPQPETCFLSASTLVSALPRSRLMKTSCLF